MTTPEPDAAPVQRVQAMLDGIVFQAGILALNAAVEAARRGDEGNELSRAAAEVRALAAVLRAERGNGFPVHALLAALERLTRLVDETGDTAAATAAATLKEQTWQLAEISAS